MTLPRFHMTSKDIQPFIIPKSYVTDRERQGDRKKAIPKRGGVEITTAHPHTSNPALFETTSAM